MNQLLDQKTPGDNTALHRQTGPVPRLHMGLCADQRPCSSGSRLPALLQGHRPVSSPDAHQARPVGLDRKAPGRRSQHQAACPAAGTPHSRPKSNRHNHCDGTLGYCTVRTTTMTIRPRPLPVWACRFVLLLSQPTAHVWKEYGGWRALPVKLAQGRQDAAVAHSRDDTGGRSNMPSRCSSKRFRPTSGSKPKAVVGSPTTQISSKKVLGFPPSRPSLTPKPCTWSRPVERPYEGLSRKSILSKSENKMVAPDNGEARRHVNHDFRK